MCESEGAICVFDETITGFRLSRGGAQELFGVKPHLSTFGKGIANGYPLSVVCGRREIMAEMENIFFSGTFGGELLSLVAANFVLDMHLKDSICPGLETIGLELLSRLSRVIEEANMERVLEFSGHPSWTFYNWSDSNGFSANEIRSFFLQEMYRHGVLLLGTNNISLSHRGSAAKKIVKVFELVMHELRASLENGSLSDKLLSKPLDPVLKIR